MSILGVGSNIIECLRIAQMIERHGELFIARVYTDREIEFCASRKAATQHYAGRWAAKEAALMALGTGLTRGVAWRDVEICNRGGAPTVAWHGAARDVFERSGVDRIHLSISHSRCHALAYAIAEG